jgi:sporulation protein YlmC with PRC-barrel domain
VRGWYVVTRAAERVGTVTDMLVDIDTLRAEFLIIDADRETLADLSDTEFALVPVGTTHVDAATRRVVISDAANRAAPEIRLRYRSTTHLVWTAGAIGTAAMLVAWLLGLF